ncbi:MAG: LytR/AlgR family response regulator transcription factor [Saprospiraceae bacterium]
MKKLKLLIVDDEPLAHNVLQAYCEKLDYVEVVGDCYDGMSTLNFLNKEQVDAVLLDIQMPDITGLELLDTLKNNAPKIIFTTAYTEYAIQGFDYDQVVDYLHKPIRLTRFIKALERLKKVLLLENKITSNQLPESNEQPSLNQSDFISIKDNKIIYRVAHSEINYIQSWGNYLKFYLKDQSIKIVRKTIKMAEVELPSNQFLRIHKSYIVNIDCVKAIDGNQIRIEDQRLPIGKSYVVSVKKIISG